MAADSILQSSSIPNADSAATLEKAHDEKPDLARPFRSKVDAEENHYLNVNQLETQPKVLALGMHNDEFIVDWEPDDCERPLNWPMTKKWCTVGIVSLITLLTALASSMIAPATTPMMREYHESSSIISSLVVSIYLVGYALGPLVLAPLSEIYGRSMLYHGSNILFVAWNVGCARSPNIAAMLVFRALCGLAGSCSQTIGGGTVADVFKQEERGLAMALFSTGPILGPMIGPIGAGFLAEAGGWRWIFYFLIIAGGVVTITTFALLHESYEPVLLERRAQKLRKMTGNMVIRSRQANTNSISGTFKKAILRPTMMLFMSPIVAAMSLYLALVYSYLYIFFTTLSDVFMSQYGWSQSLLGLSFVGLGVGCLIGNLAFGIVSDRLLKRLSAGREMKPEYRLPPLLVSCIMIPTGFIWYGWSVEKQVHYMIPIIGTVLVGIGQVTAFMPIFTYLVDSFPRQAASVLAASTVLRAMGGAFLPLVGSPLFNRLGLGWGNTLLGCLSLIMVPIALGLWHFGEKIRTHPKLQITF